MNKSGAVGCWKNRGLIDDYEKVYETYINTNNCMKCNIELTNGKPCKSTTKCMDHDHNTGLYRSIICHSCNSSNLLDTKCIITNKSTGIKNIYKTDFNTYSFKKTYKGKKYIRTFKTIEEAIEYKESFILAFS